MSKRKYNMLRMASTLLAAGVIFSGCSQTDGPSQSPVLPSGPTKDIYGTSQKGPFIKGSKVTLYELDNNLNQTGAHYSTTIDNNLGNYTIKDVSLEGPYAWLNANGYYTDEFTGEKSNKTISLNSLVDLNGSNQININILTHLAFDRTRFLVKEGKSVAEAKKQAESEVMKAFGFGEEESSFEQLDIFQGSEGDAKLLAASLMMLIADYGGDIAERMANIAFDLETDGTWDNDSLKEHIKYDIDVVGHRNYFIKVEDYLAKLGSQNIPDFVKYLKQFQGDYGDTLWGTCTNEDEIAQGVAGAFDQLYICYNSRWERYRGARIAGDAPVDTTGRYGILTDNRDGATYRTVTYDKADGTKVTWMLDMLKYATPRHIAEIEDPDNTCNSSKKAGLFDSEEEYQECLDISLNYRQYTLLEAYNVSSLDQLDANYWETHQVNQGICPDGWHIPSRQDFDDVFADNNEPRVRYNKELQNFLFYKMNGEGGEYVAMEVQTEGTIISTPPKNGLPVGYFCSDLESSFNTESCYSESFITAEEFLQCVKD